MMLFQTLFQEHFGDSLKMDINTATNLKYNKCKARFHKISYKNRVCWLSLLELYDNNS